MCNLTFQHKIQIENQDVRLTWNKKKYLKSNKCQNKFQMTHHCSCYNLFYDELLSPKKQKYVL